jgi:hypothetical protein
MSVRQSPKTYEQPPRPGSSRLLGLAFVAATFVGLGVAAGVYVRKSGPPEFWTVLSSRVRKMVGRSPTVSELPAALPPVADAHPAASTVPKPADDDASKPAARSTAPAPADEPKYPPIPRPPLGSELYHLK